MQMFLRGIAHQDDLFYLFYTSSFPMFENNDPEIPLVEKMTAMWANFAKNGEPIDRGNSIFNDVTWEKYTEENLAYLEISDNLVMKQNFFPDRMAFWETLYPS